MPKKISVSVRIAPLQRVVAEPISDPAEQAALDKLHKRERRKHAAQKGKMSRHANIVRKRA